MADPETVRGEGDRYLLSGIRRGEEDAFRQLVERYSGRLTAYAARRLEGSGIDPEDAVQESFLGLLQSLDRLDGVRSLEAYLFQILRNKIVDLANKRPEAHGLRRIALAREDDEGERRGYEPVSQEKSPSTYARNREGIQIRGQVLADVLEEYLGRLKDEKSFRDLKILELLFYASWRNRDIAEAVGTSEPTVTRTKLGALESLARLVRRHPRCDPANPFPLEDEDAARLIQRTWAENLLSCLKRSTLGAYSLGTLERDWKDYVRFHLEVAGCEACGANLADLKAASPLVTDATRARIFTSSVGFLRRNRQG
jgi:RNA polymerase sigma factor (sigma-70 family)